MEISDTLDQLVHSLLPTGAGSSGHDAAAEGAGAEAAPAADEAPGSELERRRDEATTLARWTDPSSDTELATLEASSSVVESLGLGFHLGAALERIGTAAGEGSRGVQRLREAIWFIERQVALLEQRPAALLPEAPAPFESPVARAAEREAAGAAPQSAADEHMAAELDAPVAFAGQVYAAPEPLVEEPETSEGEPHTGLYEPPPVEPAEAVVFPDWARTRDETAPEASLSPVAEPETAEEEAQVEEPKSLPVEAREAVAFPDWTPSPYESAPEASFIPVAEPETAEEEAQVEEPESPPVEAHEPAVLAEPPPSAPTVAPATEPETPEHEPQASDDEAAALELHEPIGAAGYVPSVYESDYAEPVAAPELPEDPPATREPLEPLDVAESRSPAVDGPTPTVSELLAPAVVAATPGVEAGPSSIDPPANRAAAPTAGGPPSFLHEVIVTAVRGLLAILAVAAIVLVLTLIAQHR